MILLKLDQSLTSLPEQRSDSMYFIPCVSESTGLRESYTSSVTHDGLRENVLFASSKFSGRDDSCVEFPVSRKDREFGWFRSFDLKLDSKFEESSVARDDEAKEARDLIRAWEKSGNGKIASFYAVFFVETGFRQREYKKINQLLMDIDVRQITEWSMVALLRSSFSARRYLPAWEGFLSEVRRKLEREGKDAQRILRGLDY